MDQTCSQPPRIASLLAGATEMLYGLGLGERVVAVSHECDWPPGVVRKPRVTFSHVDSSQPSDAIDRQVRELVAAGSPLYGIDVARLAELAPDLIVTQSQCDVCAVRYEDVASAVAATPALHTARILSLNPQCLDDVFADIERIGKAAGVPQRAREYVAALHARVEPIRSAASAIPEFQRPRVAVIEWIEPLMIAANWTPELVELAGGKYDLAPAGRHSVYTPWSAVLQYAPDVMIVAPCGFEERRTRVEMRALENVPGWADLPAVQSGRVHACDGSALFNRCGPRLVDTLELLWRLLHG
jgi:iron complex transport system substrate-binding protein